LPGGVHSPLFALELLELPAQLDSFVFNDEAVATTGLPPRNERQTLRRATRLDFAFIANYVAFLMLVALTTQGWRQRCLAIIIVVAALTGAVYDVKENLQILAVLADAGGSPRAASITKWWSLMAVTAAMALLTVDRKAPVVRRWTGYLSTLAGFAAVGGWIYARVHKSDVIAEAAVGRLALAWFLAYLFVGSRYVLRRGVRTALNWLATRPVLRQIARWPAIDYDETVGQPIVRLKT
jgi:hypothetical protein